MPSATSLISSFRRITELLERLQAGEERLVDMASAGPDQTIEFGPFCLHTAHRKLNCGAQELHVGGRAMDVLLCLAASKGEIVGHRTLINAAWPKIFVHEANLKVTIASLRRLLRQAAPPADYIKTVIGRGYWLDPDPSLQTGLARDGPQLPVPAELPELGTVIGRESEIGEICASLKLHRIVSVIGAGGVGKTTVAVAAAQLFADDQENYSISYVDLSRVSADEHVGSALASAMGIIGGTEGLSLIANILQRPAVLILLDTCEHLLHSAAHACDVLLSRTQNVRILATSREPLRARNERTIELNSLAVPPLSESNSAQAILRYPAPQLLVLRASESGEYELQNNEAGDVAAICRRLEGTPLALELAAPRLATVGAKKVLGELDRQLLSLERAAPRGPDRHQTMNLAIQWSYELLTDEEARVLRVVSVFAGSFETNSAIRVAGDATLSPPVVFDAIAGLRFKSMLSIDDTKVGLTYRLLDSTRAFARSRLAGEEEAEAARRSHAELHLELLADLSATPGDSFEKSRRIIDDLRLAIDWALPAPGQQLLAVRLVAAALPVWHRLSLNEEAGRYCERALEAMKSCGISDKRLELDLVVGLASASTYRTTRSHGAIAFFNRAVRLARELEDSIAECRVLGALASYQLMTSRPRGIPTTLQHMRRAALRTGDAAALQEEDQLRVQWEIRNCKFRSGLKRVERLAERLRADAESQSPRFQIHQRVNAGLQMAALNWLVGRPRQAILHASEAAKEAMEAKHGLTLIYALSQGIVWTHIQCREYELVLPYIDRLRDAIYRHGIGLWHPVVKCYEAAVAAHLKQHPSPLQLRDAYHEIRDGTPQLQHDARFALLAEAMIANGQHEDAREVIEHVFARTSSPWCLPEFLRLGAAIQQAEGNHASAVAALETSLVKAKLIDCPAWELRSALDLAAVANKQSRTAEARQLLEGVLKASNEAEELGDLRRARSLLAELS